MPTQSFLTGEFHRTVDERFRVTLPPELAEGVVDEEGETIVVKERFGCMSLWPAAQWRRQLEGGIAILRQKIEAGRMDQRWSDVQRMGRLLSTRHTTVKLANRSRILVPEGFRDFLGLANQKEVVIVGAVICVEIWNSNEWLGTLKEEMPDFGPLFKDLTA